MGSACRAGGVARRAAASTVLARGVEPVGGLRAVAVADGRELEVALGEGAGLVEAQHVGAAERLDGARVADEGAEVGQPPGGGELGRVDEERQPFGYGRDGEVHRRGRGSRVSWEAVQQPGAGHGGGRAERDGQAGPGERGRAGASTPVTGAARRRGGEAAADLGGRRRWPRRRPRARPAETVVPS